MQRPSFDPGLTQQFSAPLSRMINHDGSFNVHRRGGTWRDFHPYLHLINMRWPAFLATLFFGYLAVNTLFAAAYFAIGTEQLAGITGATPGARFLDAFFFSSHTLTTVGYGNIAPRGMAANVLSSFESLIGVLGFAVATGLLFGRVSRPSARIGFSETMVIAPYQDGMALEFRAVNRRRNSLMELEATVMLMTIDPSDGASKGRYEVLRLERSRITFFPLTWTVVHPIDPESPLHSLTEADLKRLHAEVIILIKGYDDTFSQTVLARHSYRYDEIQWGRRFAPAFHVDERGDLILEVRKVGEVAG
jgi:inward rectifier potassium channel